MAKTALEQWDETAANNTDVGGLVLSDSTQIDALDNIEREHMAQVAKWLGDDTVASASTADLGAVPGRYINITGTTTITGFGTIKAGTIKYVKFADALTLTHNGTSLILPGAANIITTAGDTAIFVSEGSGNWRCLAYSYAARSAVTLATAVAVSGSSSISFTGIPSWVRQIAIVFDGVSLSGSDEPLVQLGDSGGLETSSYNSNSTLLGGGSVATTSSTAGFVVFAGVAGRAISGTMLLTRISSASNVWIASGTFSRDDTAANIISAGRKATSATLDRVALVASGANTFDAGTVNVTYI